MSSSGRPTSRRTLATLLWSWQSPVLQYQLPQSMLTQHLGNAVHRFWLCLKDSFCFSKQSGLGRLQTILCLFVISVDSNPVNAQDRVGEAGQFELADDQLPGKVRRFAQATIHKHDDDGDGKLSSSEWNDIGGDPSRMDSDGDGLLTLYEYQRHLVAYHGPQRLLASRRDSAVSKSTQEHSPATASQPDQRDQQSEFDESRKSDESTVRPTGPSDQSKRFYVAPSRLPAATPRWFIGLDRDGDAQLSLQEFLAGGRTARSFRELDRSGDGILTISEAVGPGTRRSESPNPEPD